MSTTIPSENTEVNQQTNQQTAQVPASGPVTHTMKVAEDGSSVEMGFDESGAVGPAADSQQDDGLLAGKFKSAEELEKAYKELESKLGSKPQTQEQEAADDAAPKVAAVENTSEAQAMLQEKGLDINAFTREFESTGKLSEESYASLEAKGIGRDMVNAYIDGQRVLVEAQINEIKQVVGGEGEYQKLIAWATTNLTDQEKASYNKVLATNDLSIIKMAAQGLKARRDAVVGKDPSVIVGGSVAGGNDGLQRYRSTAEMVAAMRDPRYENDPAYRADVERRVINSNF